MSEPLNPKSFKENESRSTSKAPQLKKRKNTSSQNPKKITQSGIPKPVANRMARRIAITTGLPTLMGMGVFIGSYFVISKGIADIAPGITLLTSALCFLTGLIGLSYGILSASWDEASGSFLGLENIIPNINRMRAAFKVKDD